MTALKPVGGFCARFLVVFALLMVPWPGLKEGYATLLRVGGSFVFTSFGSDDIVRFFPSATVTPDDVPPGYQLPDPGRGLDIHIKLRSRRAPIHAGLIHTNSQTFGYLPTAFLISLIVATPIPWSRRWRALVWGLVLVNALVLLKFVLWLFYAFSQNNPIALFALDPFSRRVVHHMYQFLVVGVAGAYILPLPIWVLVSFRREDWVAVFGKAPNGE